MIKRFFGHGKLVYMWLHNLIICTAIWDCLIQLTHIDYIKLSHHGAKNNNEGIEKFVDTFSCKQYGVTIKKGQTGENKHPDRDIIKGLFERGCKIYTSTDYECTEPTDLVHRIEKKSEIGV